MSGVISGGNGDYWISTNGSGLFYWDGNDFNQFHIYNSDIASNTILDLHLDDINRLWLFHGSNTSVFCSDTLEILPSENTFESGPDYIVYPNPSRGSFRIGNCDKDFIESLTIYSIDGKLIRTIENPLADVEHFIYATGTYLLEINDGNSVSIEKIFIMR